MINGFREKGKQKAGYQKPAFYYVCELF